MSTNPPIQSAPDAIRRLHDHRRWMRRRLLDAAAPLHPPDWTRPFEIGRGSLWATVEHLYAAELVWIDALTGTPDTPVRTPITPADLPALNAAWAAVDERWDLYLASLTASELARPIARHSALWNRSYTTHAADILLHVATHAAYTTAQAMNILRHLGVKQLPGMDLIVMARDDWDAANPST